MRHYPEMALVAIILLIGAAYWNVAINSPVVFGDEGFYAGTGLWMAQHGLIPKWEATHETEIWHQVFGRPQLFFVFNAMALFIGGEFLLKLLLPLPSILAAVMLFLLFRRFNEPAAGLAAAATMLLMPGWITYGVMNYAETFAILLFISAIYFATAAFGGGGKKSVLAAGCVSGLALLTEATAFWILPVVVVLGLFMRPAYSHDSDTKSHNSVTKSVTSYLWRLKNKRLLAILLIAVIILAPWLVRNMLLFGGICYNPLPDIGGCQNVLDIPDQGGGKSISMPAVPSAGTGASLLQFGLLSYSRFAFGWTVIFLMAFGVAALATARRTPLNRILLLWFAVFIFMTVHQAIGGGRAEDAVRNTLVGFPALAAIGGLFAASLYSWARGSFGNYAGAAALIVLLLLLVPYGLEKINTMAQVKHGLDGLIDGCNWAKTNTPKDSMLYVIYAHQASWRCERVALDSVPDRNEIRFGNATVASDRLKKHGFDYLMIEQFTVSKIPYGESTPVEFLQMLDSSPDFFEKVYDNSQSFGNRGVLVFRVK